METMDFSIASPIDTIGFKTKSSVFGNIQVAIIKGADGEHAVDPTLSIEGDSADAKATGDAVNALDTRLDAAETAITGLGTRMSTAETNLNSLTPRVTSLETAVSGLATVSGHKLIITLPTA